MIAEVPEPPCSAVLLRRRPTEGGQGDAAPAPRLGREWRYGAFGLRSRRVDREAGRDAS